MTDAIPVGDDDLQAYADGRLPSERRAVVEAYLKAHPEQTARLAAIADREAVLRNALQTKFDEPIPNRLRIATIQARQRAHRTAILSRAAAVLLIAGLSGAGGWAAHDWINADNTLRFANRNATAAFNTYSVEIRHPVEVRADEGPHLVQWLSTRLQRPLTPPDLTALGFRLMGGRIVPTRGNPAALLMYDDDHGTRLTVYVQPMAIDGDVFQVAEQDGVRTITWAEHKLALAVTGRMPQVALLALARSIHDQLDHSDTAARL